MQHRLDDEAPERQVSASGFVARYSAVADRLADVGGAIAAWSLVALCVLVTAEIVSRNVLNRSTMIADEMSGYLNVALIFFGLAYTMRHDGLVRVELVYKRLRGTAKILADWYCVVISLVYVLILLYYVSVYTIFSYRRDIRSAEITETPQYVPQLALVLGCTILAIYLFRFVVNRCRDVP